MPTGFCLLSAPRCCAAPLPTFKSDCGLWGVVSRFLGHLLKLRGFRRVVGVSAMSGAPIEEICLEVGRITIAWAQIDLALDYCNVSLQRAFGKRPKWPSSSHTPQSKNQVLSGFRYLSVAFGQFHQSRRKRRDGLRMVPHILCQEG